MSNVMSFTGKLGADAVVRHTATGTAILSANVANNVGYGDKQQTLWFQVSVFGKRADGQLVSYLKKGQEVFVSGELSQNSYQANDGTTKTSLQINATVLDLVGGKKDGAATPPAQQQGHSADDDSGIPF